MASETSTNKDSNANLQELQETVSRLSAHKGVEAVLILNPQGDIVAESTVGNNDSDNSTSATIATNVQKLLRAAQAFIQTEDQLSVVQIRTLQNREIHVAPHHGYVLAVLKH